MEPGDGIRVVAYRGLNTWPEWINAVVTHIPKGASLSECQLLTNNPRDEHSCIPVTLGPFSLHVKAGLSQDDVAYRVEKVNLLPGGKFVPRAPTKSFNQYLNEGKSSVAFLAKTDFDTVEELDNSRYSQVLSVLRDVDDNRKNILKRKREREQCFRSSDSGKRHCVDALD